MRNIVTTVLDYWSYIFRLILVVCPLPSSDSAPSNTTSPFPHTPSISPTPLHQFPHTPSLPPTPLSHTPLFLQPHPRTPLSSSNPSFLQPHPLTSPTPPSHTPSLPLTTPSNTPCLPPTTPFSSSSDSLSLEPRPHSPSLL